MNIFIAGGGQVGFHLARLLSAEQHNVTVIESNPNQVEHIDYSLDVSTIAGRAENVITLKSSDAGSADLFIAATGDDEVNLISATTAKGLGAKQVVARVHDPIYTESDILYETIMGIDYIVSTQALTAHEIVNYIEHPGMVAMESFGGGLVQMMQMRVSVSPLQPGQSLKDLKLPGSVLLGLIRRNGGFEIPHGGSTILADDEVTLIGRKDGIAETVRLFRGVKIENEKIVIMGGSRTGLHLAEVLENRGKRVKLFDWNMARCTELAAVLKKTKVVCRDATSRLALEQEHVNNADIVVSVTHDDERNILASVLAKEVGARQTLAVVHQPDFASLVTNLGIDHAVTPRACLANRIMRLVTSQQSRALAILADGQAEVIEFKVGETSALDGMPLSDLAFPSGALIASIVRKDNVIIPHGDDALRTGDTIIAITLAESRDALSKLFEP